MREVRLKVRARPGLRRRPLSGGSVAVFDPRSWRTHVVGGAAAMLLTLFAERGAQRTDSLVGALGLDDAGLPTDDVRAIVDKAISDLHGCDLVELVDGACARVQ